MHAFCMHLQMSRKVGDLLNAQVVFFGTVVDGAYLLAVKTPHKCLFAGNSWRTGAVLAQSLERARGTGLSRALPLDMLVIVGNACFLHAKKKCANKQVTSFKYYI
jgi:glycosyltransferase A (GT-A) superfamily protein (DUF2064 family)